MAIAWTRETIPINRTTIETGLWAIRRYLMQKYGVDESANDVAPLNWYVGTGRANGEFLRALLTAKPFMIARICHRGGSYDEVIQRIKTYLEV